MSLKISFIILTWNSRTTINECLNGIKTSCNKENIDYEILVTDNGSQDGTAEILKGLSDDNNIQVTCLENNMGTTVTRNSMIEKCSGDIVCIIDSDAIIRDGSLKEISDMLSDNKDIGILAPKLVFSDGTVQNSVKRFPSVPGKFSRIPHIIFKINIRSFDNYEDFPFSGPEPVDYAISACWFMRRDIFDETGLFDERIFYAPEDIDFGIRIWKNGKKTLYFPGFSVVHHVQRITHKNFLSKVAFSHFFGLIYYFLKHRYFFKPSKKNISG